LRSLRGFLRGQGESPAFDDGALKALLGYSWPGNIRELQNVVFRLALTSSERGRAEDVEQALGSIPRSLFSAEVLRSRPIPELITELEREHLVRLHKECGGDLEAMGRKLGIKQRALYDRFQRLGIRPRDLQKEAEP
jgi:DNA-binding NtrC family response regulator